MNEYRITTDAAKTAAALAGFATAAGPRALAVTRTHGLMLQRQVKANASGRPGPRVQTGDYRRSIGLVVGGLGGEAYAECGSSAPQAHRLEAGFIGVDSRGRHFRQGPLPHFGPAFEVVQPVYFAALNSLVEALEQEFGR